jgi:predicted Zn-dependent protease with MMP-like domain
MEHHDFEKLVERALLELPKNIREKMENIAICIEENPSIWQLKKAGTRIKRSLLGLYQGVPKTVWGRESFSARLPDKITIFQKPIEKLAGSEKEISEKEIKELVKIVVWHEIAHHFGFSEKQVKELEKKWKINK